MARHMLVTFLIVCSVYIGLLFIIGHPFVVQAETKSLNEVSTDSIDMASHEQAVAQKANGTTVNKTLTKTSTAVEQTVVTEAKKPLFKGPTILGVSARVNLENAEQEVDQLWRQLLDDKMLINRVAWNKGNVKAYAYFHDFNTNMSLARVTIGFDNHYLEPDSSSSQITLPTGRFEQFAFNSDTGTASEKAWEEAYVHKNLIERHTLNRLGESVSVEALVVVK